MLVTLFACRASGCSGKTAVEREQEVFRIGLWEPETLDPTYASDEASTTIARSLFEGLMRPAVGNGPPRLGTASSYEANGLVYLFHLREDARWSDGVPITADDFVYSWRRLVNPESGSRASALADVIEGAQEIRSGKMPVDALGVRAIEPHTLEVRLAWPAPYFLSLMTYPAFAPLRKDKIEENGDGWTRPERMVSNGAFRLVDYRPKVAVVIEKNPYYWNAATVSLERVEFLFMEDQRTAWEWYRAGKLDWLKSTLPREVMAEARNMLGHFFVDPVLCTYYVVLRLDQAPLQDLRVRRALSLAIDRERLVAEVLMGGQVPASSLVPPVISSVVQYEPPKGAKFDPVEARELLRQAHFSEAALEGLVWFYNQSGVHKMIGEFLQEQWREHLGLEVALQAVEWKTLLDRLYRGKFWMARASWCADVADPANFLEVFRSNGPSNYAGLSDEEYDRLLNEARGRVSSDERMSLLRKAEARLLELAPIIPLYHYTRIYLLNPRVKGFEPNLLDVHPLEDIILESF